MRPRLTYANVISTLCLFLLLAGGTALATHPGGQNTISSGDIQNGQVKTDDIGSGEVKVADVGQGAVATDEIANGQVKVADIGQGAVATDELKNDAVTTAKIANGEVRGADVLDGTLTGADVANNSLKGADIDESTLDVGDAARAYARVNSFDCTGTPGTCTPEKSKGISSVTRVNTGIYCVTAPGIDSDVTPAAVTVDDAATDTPEGNASAMTFEDSGCGPGAEGFFVVTKRQPNITVDANGGTNNATAVGPADFADDVAFTIVIP